MQRDSYDYSGLEKAFYSIADFVEGDFAGNALYGINYAAKVNAFYSVNNLVDNILESIALYELNNAVKSIFKSSAEIFLLGQAVLCLVPVASGVFEFAVGLVSIESSFGGEGLVAAFKIAVKVHVTLVAASYFVCSKLIMSVGGESTVDVSFQFSSSLKCFAAEVAYIVSCKSNNANGESEDNGQEGG